MTLPLSLDFLIKKRCLRHDRRTFILFNMDEPANWAETGEALEWMVSLQTTEAC